MEEFQEYTRTVLARKLDVRTQINTPDGMKTGEVGDYIVVGEDGRQRTIVSAAHFEATHRPKRSKQRGTKAQGKGSRKSAGEQAADEFRRDQSEQEEASGNFRSL